MARAAELLHATHVVADSRRSSLPGRTSRLAATTVHLVTQSSRASSHNCPQRFALQRKSIPADSTSTTLFSNGRCGIRPQRNHSGDTRMICCCEFLSDLAPAQPCAGGASVWKLPFESDYSFAAATGRSPRIFSTASRSRSSDSRRASTSASSLS